MTVETIKIDDIEYIRKDSVQEKARDFKGMEYKIIRTYSAGVFAGYIKSRVGKEATIINARRLWYWSGANSLSQLAMEGVTNPDSCKFAMEVDAIELTEVIEVLSVTEKARKNINEVKVWKK